MYQVGDVIFYGNMGVCRVTDIAQQRMPGSREGCLYYTLVPLFQQCVVHTPVDNNKVLMRPVITRDDAERLIDLIPTIQAVPYHTKMNSDLVEHYTQSIKSYECADLIELAMSIYAKKQELEEKKRKFGVVDERFMRQAEELLFGELSVALDIPKDDIPAYIASRVEDDGKGSWGREQ